MHSFRRNSAFKNICTRLQYYFVVFLLIPGIFVVQIAFIYPKLVRITEVGAKKLLIHICLISVCFINIVGNMIFSMMMDSSLKQPVFGEGMYCDYCRMSRPAKSWHCKKCKICVIKRDHHCNFLACCIGVHNQRYFILFLAHTMIWLLIVTIYNYYLITLKFNFEGWVSAARIMNPMLRFVVPQPLGIVDVYVFYLFLNLAVIFWAGSLFFYHLRNVVNGVTSYESRFPSLMDGTKWRQNLLNVFGHRWYLAVLCPLFDSPLPNDDKIP